jgi:thiamine pyrophosphate-dependent acetolactate synthase large subunit-like protein
VNVAQAVGRALAAVGVDHVFGVVGSGNFHVTGGLVAGGARFVAARHEGGAATMADAYARMTGSVAALTVHQGCGLTNGMTGITEAAKSRTPLLVLAAEATNPSSNFFVDQDGLARAVGAVPARITSAETAVDEALAAAALALHERRTVLLNLPLEVQGRPAPESWDDAALAALALPAPEPAAPPGPEHVATLAEAIARAERPVFVAGRGSRAPAAAAAVRALADRCGALLATSAVAKGLWHDHAWSLDVSGGFATPAAAELIHGADLIVGWGCSLNMWTMRHGRLIGPDATVVQVDDTSESLGAQRELAFGVLGDVALTATAALEKLSRTGAPPGDPVGTPQGEPMVPTPEGAGDHGGEHTAYGYRTDAARELLAASGRWRDVPYVDQSAEGRIDPRTLTIALDELLPAERVVGVDSGNFMGYPSMFLDVPDELGFCFTQAYQSIGLGLATTIGAALARPDRLPVAALGDGGLMMAAAELDTVARLGLPMVVVVYNDDAYGAEVHHFAPGGDPLDTVRFPPTDIAAIARGHGFSAVTVTAVDELGPVREWLDGSRDTPLLIDAKVTPDEPAWWLEEAFRGH